MRWIIINSLKPIFNQFELINHSILNIIDVIKVEDLDYVIYENGRTINELLSHIASLYYADMLIMNESTESKMKEYYTMFEQQKKGIIKEAFIENFLEFKKQILSYSSLELQSITTSWWGVTYTRYEWVLVILEHIIHHRTQLHMTLKQKGYQINVPLFE